MKLLRPSLVVLAVTAAGICFAPIPDPRFDGKSRPESTQEQLAAQQRFNGTLPPRAPAPRDTETPEIPNAETSATAAAQVASMADQKPAADPAAATVLREAQREIEQRENSLLRNILLFLAAVAVAALAVLGFRAWANKSIPDMPDVDVQRATVKPKW